MNNGIQRSTFLIPESMMNGGVNTLTFSQRTEGFMWGVTNLLLNEVSSACDTTLSYGTTDSMHYSSSWDVNTNQDEVVACFTSTGIDVTLDVTGNDIDFTDEVEVFINGTSLGNLKTGPDNGINGEEQITIPAINQDAGENEICFVQKTSGWRWGVTDLLLAD